MSANYTPLEDRLGEKLEELRKKSGMTREALAEHIGVTPRHISALERGERKPKLNTLERIIRTLGAPTECLAYPEYDKKDSRLTEIQHMAATFTEVQQDFLLGIMRLMQKDNNEDEK